MVWVCAEEECGLESEEEEEEGAEEENSCSGFSGLGCGNKKVEKK